MQIKLKSTRGKPVSAMHEQAEIEDVGMATLPFTGKAAFHCKKSIRFVPHRILQGITGIHIFTGSLEQGLSRAE